MNRPLQNAQKLLQKDGSTTDAHLEAKRLEAQGRLPGHGEQHGIVWHGTTACCSVGATGSIWHHMGNGYTYLYSSQDCANSVKMQTVEGVGRITGLNRDKLFFLRLTKKMLERTIDAQ